MSFSLLNACQSGDIDRLKVLLNSGLNPNGIVEGRTPLTLAAYHGQEGAVCYLLDHGASVDRKDGWGRTALHEACETGHAAVVQTLLLKGADIECVNDEHETPLILAASRGHELIVKGLILAGACINRKNKAGNTALHCTASHNFTHCGILLAEAGSDVDSKNSNEQTPLDCASKEFKEAVSQALSFTIKKTICVIGNACSGKSTLIASLQSENAATLTKVCHWLFGVEDIRERTAGIEPISHTSKKYGDVVLFDFAGQHEYHGPHEMFLESFLYNSGSTVTIIVLVKATEDESSISQQLTYWLSPFSRMCTSAHPVRVIVVGSFMDKVKSTKQAKQKFERCYQAVCQEMNEKPVIFQGLCLLNCRQPYSAGIKQLSEYLDQIPIPQYKAVDTSYSICWIIARIRNSLKQKALHLHDFEEWIEGNTTNLPKKMPPAEEICWDLSATGHFLYLPNKEDALRSWLILDLPAILHKVYGTLFSSCKEMVDEFGLLSCHDLPNLFPMFESEMIHSVLISLKFCIEVDSSFLRRDTPDQIAESAYSSTCLFFPALVSAKPSDVFSSTGDSEVLNNAICWHLQTDAKHFISPRLLQTIILQVAARHIVRRNPKHQKTMDHCYSTWYNGIFWHSRQGVDVAVQITDNTLIQVIGRTTSDDDDDLFHYVSEVGQDVIDTVRQLSPSLSASTYIIRTSDPRGLLKNPKSTPVQDMIPLDVILRSGKDQQPPCVDKSEFEGSTAKPTTAVFMRAQTDRSVVEKLCFKKSTADGEFRVSIFKQLYCMMYFYYVHYLCCMAMDSP